MSLADPEPRRGTRPGHRPFAGHSLPAPGGVSGSAASARAAWVGESHSDELEKIIRRAQWRYAAGMKLGIPIGDKAFDMPHGQTRTLFLIDGFDEVALGDQEVKSFFHRMREQAGSSWRFIVFTRPAVLRHRDHLKDVPVLDLRPFRTRTPRSQVDEWLARWSSFTDRETKLTESDLARRGLLRAGKTPILLFMIARTWDESIAKMPSHADVYESFSLMMAPGKYEKGGEWHAVIVQASDELRDCLRKKGHIAEDGSSPDAMLWLMSRVAWKGKCLEDAEWLDGKKKTLAARHVQDILSEELDLDDNDASVQRTIQIGLLLAMQANLEEGTPRILFGHKSFREFFVGRYWASELHRRTAGDARDWELEATGLPRTRSRWGFRPVREKSNDALARICSMMHALGRDGVTVVSGAFEWDSDKAEANVRKHGVSFDEAATVFFDVAAVYLEDTKYDGREWVIGFSAAGRMLLVVHVERGERTRIISARKVERHEARIYRGR